MTAALINHLWQSTLFALGAGLLTLALKHNGARFRYGLWFAASVKFLIPFVLLSAAGGWVVMRLHPFAQTPAGVLAVRRVVEPFALAPIAPSAASTGAAPMIAPPPGVATHGAFHPAGVSLAAILLAVWALGAAAVLALWAVRWRRVRAALLASSPLDLSAPVPARASTSLLEPGVVGVFRQVLMFPRGIEAHLSAAELEAVLAHELRHLRRRDNLTAAIHMLVEALFWFHPLVWWIGGRLIAERERACDEGVIEGGVDPRVYAEGILKVCRFYLQSPLACAAGVSGSNLKRRLQTIMTGSAGAPLGVSKTLLVSSAAVLAVAAPLAAGLIAAVPAAARTALLATAGLKASTPAAVAEAPAAASGDGDSASVVDTRASGARTIAQSLEQGAEIVAAPGDALVAATRVEPIAPPEQQLAALTAPEAAQADAGAQAAQSPAQAQPPSPTAPSPPAGCRLPILATFRVDPGSYTPLINGQINGHKVQLAVEVSSGDAVFRSAAKALDVLEVDAHQGTIASPAFTEVGYGWVHDLELDDMPRQVLSHYDVHENFGVTVRDGGAAGPAMPAGVLGAQFWDLADEDFDLRANTISLVRPAGCGGGDTLPFNGGQYSQARLLNPYRHRVEVMVDGVPLSAQIDTSAGATILTRQGALKLGHGWPLPGAEPQGKLLTAGQSNIAWAKARFRTFSIGEETIQNPRLVVADLYGRTEQTTVRRLNGTNAWLQPFQPIDALVPDMILGVDFFHAHRVLISNSRHRLYFVYNGAPIFR